MPLKAKHAIAISDATAPPRGFTLRFASFQRLGRKRTDKKRFQDRCHRANAWLADRIRQEFSRNSRQEDEGRPSEVGVRFTRRAEKLN
jgi:hypothetical protein